MRSWQVRRVANWLNLSTPFGLLVAVAGQAEVVPGPRGLLLAGGYRPRFPMARVFTVGSVVVTGRPASWLTNRPLLLRHEERHATQWAVCGGLPFLPLYVAAMAVSMWRCGDRASGNVFERLAGLADGDYIPATR